MGRVGRLRSDANAAEVGDRPGGAPGSDKPDRNKVVLIAGDPSIKAFDNATARLEDRLCVLAGTTPGDLHRFSTRDDVVARGATLAAAPAILGAIANMAPEPRKGCLVLATSHGSPRRGLDLPRSAPARSLALGALAAPLPLPWRH